MKNVIIIFFYIVALLAFITLFGVLNACENNFVTLSQAIKECSILILVIFACGAMAFKMEDCKA